MKGAKYLSTLDALAGYHQDELEKKSRPRMTFVTEDDDLWEYLRVPFGLKNVAALFQQCIDEMRQDLRSTLRERLRRSTSIPNVQINNLRLAIWSCSNSNDLVWDINPQKLTTMDLILHPRPSELFPKSPPWCIKSRCQPAPRSMKSSASFISRSIEMTPAIYDICRSNRMVNLNGKSRVLKVRGLLGRRRNISSNGLATATTNAHGSLSRMWKALKLAYSIGWRRTATQNVSPTVPSTAEEIHCICALFRIVLYILHNLSCTIYLYYVLR